MRGELRLRGLRVPWLRRVLLILRRGLLGIGGLLWRVGLQLLRWRRVLRVLLRGSLRWRVLVLSSWLLIHHGGLGRLRCRRLWYVGQF